ncbi:MAG: hypothetical protein KC680_03470, partial [Candidatus Peregrinibacteria bacterium]|nr:hypothetical protein [Candidatus Peregrinibacteria bacterium]
MRLLIITQTVDSIDPILGFFHDWIRAFASRFESVVVLAQSVGSSSLPHNVMLVDLGKDTGKSKGMQTVSFWKEIVARRAEYDIVFVHMTPIWVLLGAPFWILLRKPMYLWYEIKRGSWKLTIASFFVKKIFAASEHGLPTVNRKQVTVGHGIDCAKFVPAPEKREKNHLIAVGRVTTIKHYEVLARAVSKLPHCTLTIAGGTITKSDKETEHALKELFHSLGIADRIEMGWVSPND